MNVNSFVATVESYVGTPFHHQGRLPGVGLDCAGVVVCALREAGVEVEDITGYSRLPMQGLFLTMVKKQCDQVTFDDLQDGDLCMFRFRSEPQHLAVYKNGQIIHALQDAKKVITQDLDSLWKARLVGCWRVRSS
jgi:cell wall-associated NlpC family hydrolase